MLRSFFPVVIIIVISCDDNTHASGGDRDLLIYAMENSDDASWEATVPYLLKSRNKYLDRIIQLLEHPKDQIRKRAIYLLGQIGVEANRCIPQLYKLLPVVAFDEQSLIIQTLKYIIGPIEAFRVVEDLLFQELRANSEAALRISFSEWFSILGSEVTPLLIRLFEHSDERARAIAAQALTMMEGGPDSVIAPLDDYLNNDKLELEIKHAIIQYLGSLGPRARQVVPSVVKFVLQEETRSVAAYTLWRIDSIFIPAIISLNPEPDEASRRLFEVLLEAAPLHLPTESLAGLARLAEHHKDETIRVRALSCISKIGRNGVGAIEMLVRILDRPGHNLEKKVALSALGNIGPRAKSTASTILRYIHDPQCTPDLKAEALETLIEIGMVEAPMLNLYVDSFRAPHLELKRVGLYGLWKLGAVAHFVLPELREYLNAGDPSLRVEVVQTIRQLEGQNDGIEGIIEEFGSNSELVTNGTCYDKGFFEIPSWVKEIAVPANAIVSYSASVNRVGVRIQKRLGYMGYSNISMVPKDLRQQMGCAFKLQGERISICTFGEWTSREGGTELKLLLEVPSRLLVILCPTLQGPLSPANHPILSKGTIAHSWTRIITFPDAISANQRE